MPRLKNGTIYLVPNDSYEKFYLAVKGLTAMNKPGNVQMLAAATVFAMFVSCYGFLTLPTPANEI